jgi:hypothetical protein
MTASGYQRTSRDVRVTSALPPMTNMDRRRMKVGFCAAKPRMNFSVQKNSFRWPTPATQSLLEFSITPVVITTI